MWPLTFGPQCLAPLLTSLQHQSQFQGVAQVGVVTSNGEPSDDDDNSSKKKHNIRMPHILLIEKLYHEKRGKPSLIKNIGEFPTGGIKILISGNGPLGSRVVTTFVHSS
jgi:hypothetical protein